MTEAKDWPGGAYEGDTYTCTVTSQHANERAIMRVSPSHGHKNDQDSKYLTREAHIIDDRPLPSDRHGLDFIIPVQYEDRVGDRRRAREGEVHGGGAVTESDNHSTRSGGSGRARNHSDRLRSSQKTSDHVSGPI